MNNQDGILLLIDVFQVAPGSYQVHLRGQLHFALSQPVDAKQSAHKHKG